VHDAAVAGPVSRALTDVEWSVLAVLVDATRSPDLLAQLAAVRVTQECKCGCPTISFASPAVSETMLVVAEAEAEDGAGSVLLFATTTGLLVSLEYAWVSDIPPSEFPSADSLTTRRA
jgi:hypothetical protein